MNRLLVGTFAILSLVLGAGIWSVGAGTFQGDRDVDYLTSKVSSGQINLTITATGSLQAVSTVEVSTQLSGQIAELQADFNDAVVVGQTLAKLDQRGFMAHVQQSQAELDMAHENVAILSAKLEKAYGVEKEELARRKVFQARIEKARVKLVSSERRLKRIEALVKRGNSSDSAIDDAQYELETAAAELREATALADAHEYVVASSRAGRLEAEAELANAHAALPLRQATLTLAELDLERSTIRAPIDGVLVGRNVEQGQTVAASFDAPTLFTIAGDLAEMEIHANIDETDIGKIAIGQTVEFSVDAYNGRTFKATVNEIRLSAQVIQGVVIYTVILKAPNAQRLLLPGMTATVRIAINEVGPVRLLPLAALRFTPQRSVTGNSVDKSGASLDIDSDQRTVWVLAKNRQPEPRQVRLGIDNGRDIAVLDGTLREGEQVITGRAPGSNKRQLFGIRF